MGQEGPVWFLPPGIIPASGSGACGVSAPRDLGITCCWSRSSQTPAPAPLLPWEAAPRFPFWAASSRTETQTKTKVSDDLWLEGPACPPSRGTQEGVAAHMLQPRSHHGTWPRPGPRGSAHSFPATGARLQAVSPLNERGCGPCAVLSGAVGEAGTTPFLLSSFRPAPASHASSCPSFCLSIHLFANLPTHHPSVHASIHLILPIHLPI